jgi:hypothetical protein
MQPTALQQSGPSKPLFFISRQPVPCFDQVCSLLGTCLDACLRPAAHNKRPETRIDDAQPLGVIHSVLRIHDTTVVTPHHGGRAALTRIA